MTATHAGEIVDGYLKRLERELADLPPGRRKEVVGQIAEHIADARAELSNETDADLLTIIDRLGEPDEIAAEARANFEITPSHPGLLEILALVFLGLGSVVLAFPPVLWAMGTGFVWRSKVWSPRAKYVGAYIPFVIGLAGIVVSALVGGVIGGHDGFAPFALATLMVLLLPLGSAIYLGIRIRRRLPVLTWMAIAIIGVAVYVPAISTYVPARISAFIANPAPAGAAVSTGARKCAAFYGTVRYAPDTPMYAAAPVSVGICWDGQNVVRTWGPDCPPEYGLGLVVRIQSCTASEVGDGSLIVTVQSSVAALTAPLWVQSRGSGWRITPDGTFMQL